MSRSALLWTREQKAGLPTVPCLLLSKRCRTKIISGRFCSHNRLDLPQKQLYKEVLKAYERLQAPWERVNSARWQRSTPSCFLLTFHFHHLNVTPLSSASPKGPSMTPPCIWHCWNRAPYLFFSCTFPVPLQPQTGWHQWKTGLGRKRWEMEQNGQTRHYPTKAFSAIRPGLLGCSGLTAGLPCRLPLSIETSPNSYLDERYKTIINEDMQFCLCFPLGPPTANCRSHLPLFSKCCLSHGLPAQLSWGLPKHPFLQDSLFYTFTLA